VKRLYSCDQEKPADGGDVVAVRGHTYRCAVETRTMTRRKEPDSALGEGGGCLVMDLHCG
jgi:hypothetical protein